MASFYLRRNKCHIFHIYSNKENMAIQMIGERQEKITFTRFIIFEAGKPAIA